MQLSRCPICHSRIHLEGLVQDESGRSLMALITKLDSALAPALVAYLGLFRAAKRDLANDRALRLAQEVVALAEPAILAAAAAQTVETMRTKAQTGAFKPLTNHNYLIRVIEGTTIGEAPVAHLPALAGNSKAAHRKRVTEQVLDINNTDW
jgi:hypothetical protein